MKNPESNHQETIYSLEKEYKRIELTPEQKEDIRNITLNISKVDRSIRQMAIDDVIKTIGNGHPLNRLITDKQGNVTGYIACEDFVPHEAHIKYFATTGFKDRNLFREIPAFFKFAKDHNYNKLNFHGWNEKLNRVLLHFGFGKIRTDSAMGFDIDFYEKELTDKKTPEAPTEKRKLAFEEKYLETLADKYKQTIDTFYKESGQRPKTEKEKKQEEEKREKRARKEKLITDVFITLSNRLQKIPNFKFGMLQKAILKLKLARHFQNNESIDLNTLYDAIMETPKFLNKEKGHLTGLLRVHEAKTLERIAEIRKKRAEITGDEKYNPYEALFTTKSQKYYLARLLNMPHLEQESAYMNHCVGTSDSYVNRMKKGEIEILSFRHVPKINSKTQQLEEDKPIITIEYNLKTKTIEQMKKYDDELLQKSDPYFSDVIDALKQLRTTRTDTGKLRDFKINSSELSNIHVSDYHIFTENGEVSYKDFDPDKGDFILKMGKMEITPEISKKDAVKIIKIVEKIEIKPEEIAFGIQEVRDNTKFYLGEWSLEVFQKIKQYSNIQYLYEQFPDKKIFMMLDFQTNPEIDSVDSLEKAAGKENIYITDWSKEILPEVKFSKEKQTYNLVRFSVAQLGFPNGATTEEIYNKATKKLGLELCPAEVGPHLRLQYSGKEWMLIAMKQISDRDGNPNVFNLIWNGDRLELDADDARLSGRWFADDAVVFCFRPSSRA